MAAESFPSAPGEIVSIYGTDLGPAAPQSATGNLASGFPTSLANVQVWFDSLPGTMLLAYQGQLNVIAPFELKPGSSVNLQVWRMGLPSANIFTGGHEYHSVREWASLQDMAAAAATIVRLAEVWTRPEHTTATKMRQPASR